MKNEIRIVSPLEKVFCRRELKAPEYSGISALRGETIAFQIAFKAIYPADCRITPDCGNFPGTVRIREVRNVPCLMPAAYDDPFVLSAEPGLYPDALAELDEFFHVTPENWHAVWVSVAVPENCPPGRYDFRFDFTFSQLDSREIITTDNSISASVEILPVVLAPQKFRVVHWFYADCIQQYYSVPCWSEEHWALLKKYFRNTAEHGNNVLLTPLWTYPLDTRVGGERPDCQLLGVSFENGRYQFDFTRLGRWFAEARECGLNIFEFSHAFTQWGAHFCPKVLVRCGGKVEKHFGWNTPSDSEEYRFFLTSLMKELIPFLRTQNVIPENGYFHVSDEPQEAEVEDYRKAYTLLKSLIGEYPVMDALSEPEIALKSGIPCPVPVVESLEKFKDVPRKEKWTYYAGGYANNLPNRHAGMPSIRTRVLGVLLYAAKCDGFLNWAYNFWFTQYSRQWKIDPWNDTDAGRGFRCVNSYLVYPGKEGPADSIRSEVMADGFRDFRALQQLEAGTSRDHVMALIHSFTGENLSMTEYPHDDRWLLDLRDRVNRELAEA